MALKCKHCGSNLTVDALSSGVKPAITSTHVESESGSLVFPILSLVFGIFCVLAFPEESKWDKDSILGIGLLSMVGLIMGALSIHKQKAGKGLAIAGVVLSAIALCAVLVGGV